ncbi:MAG TPA: hypothetical protein VFG33_34565 [Kribbella sp.]|uniref:hypothetical protein n=1 Tax=Kribbella sp. TaxID=1871183 RepID=UPI002D78D136|nr:hypothetical protein [Kribbella sp.]HET6298548.1 hypothetical protein [Kribbella sp.]
MTDGRAGLGQAARALLDSGSSQYAELTPAELREGIVELVAGQESDYLEYEMLEIDIALVRAMRLEIPDLDGRLIEWLGDRPSTARLGVTCRALWQLWSPANPHPPIDPAAVRRLMAAAAQVAIGINEVGAYRAALGFAADQIDDPRTLAAIDQEVTRLQ